MPHSSYGWHSTVKRTSSNSVVPGHRVERRESQNWVFWSHALWIWPWLSSKTRLFSTRVSVPNLMAVGQAVRAYMRRTDGKIAPLASRLSRPLKVIQSDRIPVTYY